jgi:hypothetical protein
MNFSFFQFEKFFLVMTSNVVDSNMFMRCLILSYEHFSSHQEFSGRKWNYFAWLTHRIMNYFSYLSIKM